MQFAHHTRTTLTLGGIAVLLLIGVAAIPQQAGSPAAYVNSELILRQTPGYSQAESTFTAEMASYQAEAQRLQQVWDSALAAFQQQEPLLTPTVREQRMAQLRQMQTQSQTQSQALSQRAEQRQNELRAPLEDRIQRVIDGLRAERNIGLIFDVGSPSNSIISGDPALDLTSVVIQRLNSGGR